MAIDRDAYRKGASIAEKILFNRSLNRLTHLVAKIRRDQLSLAPPQDFPTLMQRIRHVDGDYLETRRGYADRLKAFTQAAFDFRRSAPGRFIERWQAKKVRFSRNLMKAIHTTSRSLKMSGEPIRPMRSAYDIGFVLGGRGAPVLMRMLHLRRLMEGKYGPKVMPKKIGLLGSQREVSQDERNDMINVLGRLTGEGIPVDMDHARRRIAEAESEFDMMSIAAELVFGFRPDESLDRHHSHGDHKNSKSIVRPLGMPDGFGSEFVVVSAPSSDPSRRANTPDSYDFARKVQEFEAVLKDVDGTSPKPSVLVVNTQHYIFQEPDAYRMFGLPAGASIEMCGYPFTPPYVAENDPRYLWDQGFDVFHAELVKVEKEQNKLLRKAGFNKADRSALHGSAPEDRQAMLESRRISGALAEHILAGETRLLNFLAVPRNQLQEMHSAVDKSCELVHELDLHRHADRGVTQDSGQSLA
jgi:hypothetical protein